MLLALLLHLATLFHTGTGVRMLSPPMTLDLHRRASQRRSVRKAPEPARAMASLELCHRLMPVQTVAAHTARGLKQVMEVLETGVTETAGVVLQVRAQIYRLRRLPLMGRTRAATGPLALSTGRTAAALDRRQQAVVLEMILAALVLIQLRPTEQIRVTTDQEVETIPAARASDQALPTKP